MDSITIAITAASYSGNKGAAAMLQSSISQLKEAYGPRLKIYLMSVYPSEDRAQCPHRSVSVIPAQPQRLLFLAFPCAVLYRAFGWCPALKALLLRNHIIKAYAGTDFVIDEAGISFSDSRGFILNTYAFVCMAVPMLMGVPVVKYSQAMGPFCNRYNRFLAKWILPKAKLVIARGQSSYRYLRSIGIHRQARLYADGAFTMPDAPDVEERVRQACMEAGFSHMVALSVSSVVERKCSKIGIQYREIMCGFIFHLISQGYRVFMFANAARIHSAKPRNNDLLIGSSIYKSYCQAHGASGLIWQCREMDAEEIRAYIGHCECLVASRFHAMVFALSKGVPVLLIGWSHKYEEVLAQFGLSSYAVDYASLRLGMLKREFGQLMGRQEEIRKKIKENFPSVQESSRQNIRSIAACMGNPPPQAKFAGL